MAPARWSRELIAPATNVDRTAAPASPMAHEVNQEVSVCVCLSHSKTYLALYIYGWQKSEEEARGRIQSDSVLCNRCTMKLISPDLPISRSLDPNKADARHIVLNCTKRFLSGMSSNHFQMHFSKGLLQQTSLRCLLKRLLFRC